MIGPSRVDATDAAGNVPQWFSVVVLPSSSTSRAPYSPSGGTLRRATFFFSYVRLRMPLAPHTAGWLAAQAPQRLLRGPTHAKRMDSQACAPGQSVLPCQESMPSRELSPSEPFLALRPGPLLLSALDPRLAAVRPSVPMPLRAAAQQGSARYHGAPGCQSAPRPV